MRTSLFNTLNEWLNVDNIIDKNDAKIAEQIVSDVGNIIKREVSPIDLNLLDEVLWGYDSIQVIKQCSKDLKNIVSIGNSIVEDYILQEESYLFMNEMM